jgi:hypothetical protein
MKKLVYKAALRILKKKDEKFVPEKGVLYLEKKDKLKPISRDFSTSYHFPRAALYLILKLKENEPFQVSFTQSPHMIQTIGETIKEGELERARDRQYQKYLLERTKVKENDTDTNAQKLY